MKTSGLCDNLLNMQKIYKKWWFWVLVVIVLVPAALYLPWYIPWKFEQWGIERLRGEEQAIWEKYEAENEALVDAYRNDTYGGTTPEETLRLYIDALERKDYDLSAKYYVYEKQPEVIEMNPRGVESGGFASLIDAYRNGSIKSTPYESGDKYEIEVYPKGEDVPFGFIFSINPFTRKWKILD